MIAIDVTDDKFFVYSEGGLLYQRVDFEKQVKEHGKPVEVSSNGKLFIF